VGFSHASTAVVGDDIYFLVSGVQGWPGAVSAFLRYSIGGDSWQELTPPGGDLGWYQLVGAGDVVVAFSGSDEAGSRPDLVFDPRADGDWEELPDDPLSSGFDRTMAWSGRHLYLFDHELVANPGSESPTLTRAARMELGAGEWERLPDSEILTTGPWFTEGDLMVNAALGGADGGEVNGWGRRYPNGGIFDTSSTVWSQLPDAPEEARSAGVLGSDDAMIYAARGWLLDLDAGSWIELPELPESPEYTRRNVVTAGADAVVFGGERWEDGSDGELLGDAWMWRSGRTPDR
jgi:hypothetical protein